MKKRRQLPIFLVLIITIIPITIIALYSSSNLFNDLSKFSLSRRQTVAFLVATTIKENLDKVTDIGLSISTRMQFRRFVEVGNWNEAIKTLEEVPLNFSYIDRISLFDPSGRLMAVTKPTPELLSIIGDDFSYRDYYQGVIKTGEIYVAEAIKPAVPLGYNLMPVTVPIRSETDQKLIGVMMLLVKMDTISEWTRGLDIGQGGFVYVVDKNGHLIAHPKLLPAPNIIDFSQAPLVKKVLSGERGVEIVFDPIENDDQLIAYEPIPKYDWGAFVVQPTRTAFLERNEKVKDMIVMWALVILLAGCFLYRLLSTRRIISNQRDRERLLIDSIGDGVFAIDRSWNITLWNKSASELTGWSAKEAVGKPFRSIVKFINAETRKEKITFIDEAMLFGEIRFMENHTLLIQKDGQEVPVGDSASPIFGDDGRVNGCIVIFRDVSKDVEIEKVKDDFTFRIVHDLRSPLTVMSSILGNEYMIKECGSKDQLKDWYELLNGSTKQMLGMVNDLLASAKAKKIGGSSQKIAITEIIREVAKTLKPVADRRGVNFQYSPPSDLPLVTVISQEHTREIFTNLVNNAIKYNKEGGLIIISHEIVEGFLRTDVKDTGIGIASKNIDKVFAAYNRVNEREGIQGTGLGLYIVKRLVEEAKGKIEVDSKEGEGTTFSVYLPI
jgi:PAS domain S-box-containing protein